MLVPCTQSLPHTSPLKMYLSPTANHTLHLMWNSRPPPLKPRTSPKLLTELILAGDNLVEKYKYPRYLIF